MNFLAIAALAAVSAQLNSLSVDGLSLDHRVYGAYGDNPSAFSPSQHTCATSLKRLQDGPANFEHIKTQYTDENRRYTDETFEQDDMMYQSGLTASSTAASLRQKIIDKDYVFLRLWDTFNVEQGTTLWGTNDLHDWHDVNQGSLGNCYIFASMGILSERPDLVKSVFLTQTDNEIGIYALRFYILGKPWIVTIDDIIPMNGPESSPSLLYARLGDMSKASAAYWGPVIEKAWAKLKGSYENSAGGFIQNGLRAMVGCPVFSYWFEDMTTTSLELFNMLHEYDQNTNYLMGASTDSGVSDSYFNTCNVVEGHAYSIISVFELKDESGTTQHRLYMLRNPWSITYYNGTFNHADSRWTEHFKSQVPYGVDPTTSHNDGIYFVESANMATCFNSIQIGHYIEGFSNDWYDKQNDYGSLSQYKVTVPRKTGSLYFAVETYYSMMAPYSCSQNVTPIMALEIYRGGTMVHEAAAFDQFNRPFLIADQGDAEFLIRTQYLWFGYPEADFSVSVYSDQDLEILDYATGEPNVIHMDGKEPSGFRVSNYREGQLPYYEYLQWLKDNRQPSSLEDMMEMAEDFEDFMLLFGQHWYLVFVPFEWMADLWEFFF